MRLKFKDVLPNPWRDLKGNPLKPEKVAELVSSINTTGFWDNVVVRKNKAGKYELAYGHHRIAAAIEAGLESADFIVKDLSDALMIKIMDNENREVYASSPNSMIEAVKAVVQALSEGSIPPFDLDLRTQGATVRFAPSFSLAYFSATLEKQDTGGYDFVNPKGDPKKAYNALAIAAFLGRLNKPSKEHPEGSASDSVGAALEYLCLKELGRVTNSVLTKDGRPIATCKLEEITKGL